MNIYLIGYRCTGKTTIGRMLAYEMGFPFFDTDELIIKNHGRTITEIVLQYGWAYFRAKERELLLKISSKAACIVATGGGIVLDDVNIALMKKSGVIIWLRARIENVKRWILADCKTLDTRPSLTGKEVMDDVDNTFYSRLSIYRTASDLNFFTDNFSFEFISRHILYLLIRRL